MAQSVSTSDETLRALTYTLLNEEAALREGGGSAGRERQKRLGRLTARERVARLLDNSDDFLEIGLWSAHKMYPDVGEVPAAGLVTGIGVVSGRPCMIIANDATVKAGAFFPQTVKKLLRAQRIAFDCFVPIIYLVDSAGVFLPMQDEIFPDENDFGRIFRNNAVFSAAGLPQYAAIMGNCIAGGAYLPVLCDKLLMTEGSGLYLAGPALVKAAIGQVVTTEELGGAQMHAEISGTIDFREPNDESCLDRIRSLIEMLPADTWGASSADSSGVGPARDPDDLYNLISADGRKEYDAHDVLACIVDAESTHEYKAEYGKSLLTTYAKIGGRPVGVIANQRMRTQSRAEGLQIGGVVYADSADKAARFVMDCNQMGIPLVFLQDVVGFMVGKSAEHSGIIRSGAKLVNAVSNSVVPKITVIMGGSFGAGNYAMCGRAYDPTFFYTWPCARYAVMGADQAADTIFTIQKNAAERDGRTLDHDELERLHALVRDGYIEKVDIRYGAARGWLDAIIAPHTTRYVLIKSLSLATRKRSDGSFRTGVLQV